MKLPFFKLQGTGNDFIAFDNRDGGLSLEMLQSNAPSLCDRRFGIGADGILAIFPADGAPGDYTMVYLNADGSNLGMCGNGGRCIARLAANLGFADKHVFNVHGFPYQVHVEPDQVTLSFPAQPTIQAIDDAEFGSIDIIYTGTEHICIRLDNPEILMNHDWIRTRGRALRYDSRFAPKGTNVNFYYPISSDSIMLITYERGVEDITLSCGTGSLAASISHLRSQSDGFLNVECPGGRLQTRFDYNATSQVYENLLLKGPAEIVFQGKISI